MSQPKPFQLKDEEVCPRCFNTGTEVLRGRKYCVGRACNHQSQLTLKFFAEEKKMTSTITLVLTVTAPNDEKTWFDDPEHLETVQQGVETALKTSVTPAQLAMIADLLHVNRRPMKKGDEL
jgi:hypothetical protein